MTPEPIGWDEGLSSFNTFFRKVEKILEGAPNSRVESEEYMRLYTTVHKMCIQVSPHDYSHKLYDRYHEAVEDYMKQTVLPCLRKKHGEYMLEELIVRWLNHKDMVRRLSHFLSFIDSHFIERGPFPTLREVGLTCFRDVVYHEMKSKAKDAVIALINEEREGQKIKTALLKGVLEIYVEIGMGKLDEYEKDFESFMLQDTTVYYSGKVSSWIHEGPLAYLQKYEECLAKERERCTHYLHLSTEPKLVANVQNELLLVALNQLLENEHFGFRSSLRDEKMDNLSTIYMLYSKSPQGLQHVANIFKQHVDAEGNALVKQADGAANSSLQKQDLISDLSKLHVKYMVYVTNCFQNQSFFHQAFNEAFKIFCNKTVAGRSIAELLATFFHKILKKGGSEMLSDKEMEDTFENAYKLLEHIKDKDMFFQIYWKKQSNRLLCCLSVNVDNERSILTKLQGRYGCKFTYKMERQVDDIVSTREIQKRFELYLASEITASPKIDLSVTVITKGWWPRYQTCDINLPSEMAKCCAAFNPFYKRDKGEKRNLTWIYSLGNCEIIGNFDEKQISLIVSTYQAALLMLFNTTERMSYNEILQQLNLSRKDILFGLLQSLSCEKHKILTKEPSSPTISESDFFEVNSNFTYKKQRIKTPLPSMERRIEEVVEDLSAKRRYAIDACLVRITKKRKTMRYEELLSECNVELGKSFTPEVKMIKSRIEDLIGRDYLERASDDPNIVNYMP